MDLGLLFGFLGTWAVIVWALMYSGNIMIYYDLPSVIIVFGCCLTLMFFAAPAGKVVKSYAAIRKALFWRSPPIGKLITDMVGYAEIARRDGILSLEATCKDIEDPFVVQGIQMAVDGTDPELIEQIMLNDLETLADRHDNMKFVFDTASKYAPAMGMVGTLVGLIAMLADLSDPSAIGAGMAVALITTLYGAMVSNMLSGPLADRLARRSSEEVMYKTVIVKGVMSIQSGDNPRVVEQKLRTFLPPSMRPRPEEEAA